MIACETATNGWDVFMGIGSLVGFFGGIGFIVWVTDR